VSVRSYKYRLRPNRTQDTALYAKLRDFCGLYNAGLQARRGIPPPRHEPALQASSQRVGGVPRSDPDGLGRWSFSALQQVLRRLDQTYTAFFKCGHGLPRFRASARYHAATFRVGDELTIRKDRRLGVLGGIKVVWHRALPEDDELGTAILTRQQGKWYVVFSVEAAFAEACGTGTVGIDLGLNLGLLARCRRRRVGDSVHWLGANEARSAASRPGRGWLLGRQGSPGSVGIIRIGFPGPWSPATAASRSKTST
jgi:putative transposase